MMGGIMTTSSLLLTPVGDSVETGTISTSPDTTSYPPHPHLSTTRRRSSAAFQTRPDSLTSIDTTTLTAGQPTPNDVTDSRAFLLSQPIPAHTTEHIIPALERVDLAKTFSRASHTGHTQPRNSPAPNEPSAQVVLADHPHGDPSSPVRLEGGETIPGEPIPGTNNGARSYLEGKGKVYKAIFVITTCSAQLIAQGQFGMIVIPLVEIGKHLGTEDSGELSWMAASYGLTVGMFLIASGRLGDLYGPKLLWLLGYLLVFISNIASGFCKNRIAFDITRALGGAGAAMSVPNAVAILGRTYPPGFGRSLVFAILGAIAPVGFVSAGFVAAVFADKVAVPWIFWFTAIFVATFGSIGILVIPADDPIPPAASRRKFDYVGTLLLITALGLFNFTWNQGPLVGWDASYVWALLLVSVVFFTAFFFWERRVGRDALIPVEVLGKSSLLTYLSLWLGWMSLGIFLFYTTLFLRNIKGVSTALGVALRLIPCVTTGVLAALLVPTLITRFSGHSIFFVSMVAFLIGNILASLATPSGSYWALTFPSLVICIFGPDLSFATGQLIVSNAVEREFQGIAAGIVSVLTNYSMSIGLGMAGTVERYIAPHGPELKGYRAAFYTGIGLAAVAVVVVGLFVRVPKMAHYRE